MQKNVKLGVRCLFKVFVSIIISSHLKGTCWVMNQSAVNSGYAENTDFYVALAYHSRCCASQSKTINILHIHESHTTQSESLQETLSCFPPKERGKLSQK